MNILALEVSTSSAKSIIYSNKKGIIDSNNIQFNKKVSNVTTQNPEGVLDTAIQCVKGLVEKNRDIKIDFIVLSSTWHSFLLLDKQRNPISKIRTWADTSYSKTASIIREDSKLNKWVYHKTGCPIHSIYPVWKWMHLLKEKKISNNNDLNLSSKAEYIFEKLTGEIAISKSSASGTGMFNINTLKWDEDILGYANINKNQLAPLKPYDHTGSLKKDIAVKLGLKGGIPVSITGPDGALNQIGSGALKSKVMTLSVGTSGALRMIVNDPLIPEEPSTWCYYVGEKKRLAGAATSGAGNCIEWFKNNIDECNQSLEDLSNRAQKAEHKDNPIFLPFLYGERCPGWQDDKKGGFLSLTGRHSIGELYYSVLEGVLFNLYQSYKILINIDKEPKKIKISGGIINSKYWLQMAADIFQKNIMISNTKDASLMGAIAIGLKITDNIKSLKDFNPEVGKIIKPKFKRKNFYDRRFNKYMEWYNKTN